MQSKFNRLDRYLSKTKLIKRKNVRLLLAQKRVTVNQCIATDTQQIIGPFCEVILDGEILQKKQAIYLMLNKPVGVVSATEDAKHKTVFDLIDSKLYSGLHLAGRLDLNTSGLIILTNDGRFSRSICSPEKDIKKHYIVTLQNSLNTEYIDAFAQGMYFQYEDITTKPAQLMIASDKVAHVFLSEGKYHQIKRMFGRFRNPVVALHRQAIGPLTLPAELKPGEYRALTQEELYSLQQTASTSTAR